MNRNASAFWEGTLKEGHGKLVTQSGTIADAPFSFGTRFETENGLNPEELVAAALASCYTMSLAHRLDLNDLRVDMIRTTVYVALESERGDHRISKIDIEITARIHEMSDMTEGRFKQIALDAKSCPVARLLNAEITLEAKLLSSSKTAA